MPVLKEKGSGWEWVQAGEREWNPGRKNVMSKKSQALPSEHLICGRK